MRIFQDKTSLSANPALWLSIEQALEQSEYLLLLASPASAKSSWVQQEVQWWFQNRSAEKLIIGLTEGVIRWDSEAGDFDWEKTSAISSSFKGAFRTDPLYADFRAAKANGKYVDSDPIYRNALLDVAAPLMGQAKDDLDGEDIRLHRRAKRTAWAVAISMAILVFAALVIGSIAHQRQKTAASRALASEATSHLDDRTLAMLLSIESRRIADTVEARRSLLATIQRVPNTEAFLWGHTDGVTKAIFSPDGKTILSAGWDDRILLWSVASHQLIGRPIAGLKGLVSVAFNADGSRFASAASGSIVIWDTKSQRAVGSPFNAKEDFVHIAFSPNEKLLAASTGAYGGHPSEVFLWDIVSHQLIGEPILGSNFAFSPDNTLLAIARYEELILYDLRSHEMVKRTLSGPAKNISAVAFSQDGTMVAAGSEDKTIVLWDVRSQRPLGTLTGHSDTVDTLLFDPNGETLFSGSLDGTIIRWDVESLRPIDAPVKGFGASISSIFLNPDGQVKALALEKDRAIILDVNDDPPLGRRIRASEIGSSSSATVAFSPDGRFLASSGDFGEVLVWDIPSGKLSGIPLAGHQRPVSSLAYTPNGKVLVSGSIDGSVIFWDTATHTALGQPLTTDGFPIWSMACSPDGKTVAAGGDARLVFFDVASRKQLGPPITSQKDRIWSLDYSPDGKLLASAGNDLTVMVWKTGNQALLANTLGKADKTEDWELMPVGVSFSPDGRLLATSTRGHSVTIWKVSSGQPLAPVLYGHTGAVSSLVFRPDGKVLASGSADGDIRLWDVETHELLGSLYAQQKAINKLAFSPSKDTLASIGEDDSIIFWDVDFEDWISRACHIANRNLTPSEWNTYLGKRPYRKTCPDL